jgi:hypothetical protein
MPGIAAFFDLFAATERVVTLYSQGVNQSWQGTDKPSLTAIWPLPALARLERGHFH